MKAITMLLIISAAFYSCREEIIPPDSAGNLNQPVIERYYNSYSFIINAEDITYNAYDYLVFDYNRSQIFISLIDYSSGYVNISVFNKTRQILYNKRANTDIQGDYYKIEGQIPESLQLNFQDFTGKLKITVSRI